MDYQRASIYSHRDWILGQDDYDEHLKEIFEDVVDRLVESSINEEELVNKEELSKKLLAFGVVEKIDYANIEECKDKVFKILWINISLKKMNLEKNSKKLLNS
nr:hypothetical protein [Marinitoga lauensis]